MFLTAAPLIMASLLTAPLPPPTPSGMDLLYSDRVVLGPNNEPMIPIGIIESASKATIESKAGIVLDYYEKGIHKQARFPENVPIEILLVSSNSPKRRYFVDIEGFSPDSASAAEAAALLWKSRGFPSVEVLADGTIMALGGQTVDNRELRIVINARSKNEAKSLAQHLFKEWNTRAMVSNRLLEQPWGELKLKIGGAPVALATSYIRLRSENGTPLKVHNVVFGKGYSWEGSETRSYTGEIYVAVNAQKALSVVNVQNIENILEGVVPSEIFASSPPEALKAQAVAARNQILAKLGRRHRDAPYHLCSDQHCQVYTGLQRRDERTSLAVAQTYGEALFLGAALVDTVYSSSCGGHTEDNEAVWGSKANPALRAQPDWDPSSQAALQPFTRKLDQNDIFKWVYQTPQTYCQQASKSVQKKFRWRREYSADELNKILLKRFPNMGKVRRLEVKERGRGGRVISLEIIGTEEKHTIFHELPIRRLFKNLNSGTFILEENRRADGQLQNLTFVGGGWGHGVGMCQMGAIGRAEAGQKYKTILRHYYNGSEPRSLYQAR
ncbi:SpoIID/LytB domain-containing protein [Myxococcota bacterium]|nr:SpoIID/LytB domain-containing protein [Myxococcota bacterium]